jgi:hypothetical protein
MQCKEFESVLEQEGLASLSIAASSHLAECAGCQNLFADLSAIVSSAREFPAEVNPPERLWVSLRAQLESEGLIVEPPEVAVSEQASWWKNLSFLFKPPVLATAGVGLALVLAVLLTTNRHTVVPPNKGAASAVDVAKVPASAPLSLQAASSTPPTSKSTAKARPAAPPTNELSGFRPAPSEDVRFTSTAALGQAENDVPSRRLAGNPAVDAALRQNLETVNQFIAECEQHLKQYPQDQLARDYLYGAYRQKAELLAAMLDSERSEQ